MTAIWIGMRLAAHGRTDPSRPAPALERSEPTTAVLTRPFAATELSEKLSCNDKAHCLKRQLSGTAVRCSDLLGMTVNLPNGGPPVGRTVCCNVMKHLDNFSTTDKLAFDNRIIGKPAYEVLSSRFAKRVTSVAVSLESAGFKMSPVITHEAGNIKTLPSQQACCLQYRLHIGAHVAGVRRGWSDHFVECTHLLPPSAFNA